VPDRKAAERLDAAVEDLMAARPLDRELPAEVADLLRIAADLRDLPSADFKARLAADLRASAVPTFGPPLRSEADIVARLADLATPRLVAHDIRAGLADLPELTMRFLAQCGKATVVLSRYSTDTPIWERHPAGDELLWVVDGALAVTTLGAEGGLEHTVVEAGSLFVCRRGLWHWPRPRGEVSLLSLTPGEGTINSTAADPRQDPATSDSGIAPIAADRRDDVADATPPTSAIVRDLPAALGELSAAAPLAITRETTEAEANDAVREIGRLEDRFLGVMRFSGTTPWERHPDGDELLHVLDGEVDVTLLTDDGPVDVAVPAGSLFVCPRGLWHRQTPRTAATVFFATPTATSEASWDDDPRH
jgi:quercetin dioxygenase-like cupin family protein